MKLLKLPPIATRILPAALALAGLVFSASACLKLEVSPAQDMGPILALTSGGGGGPTCHTFYAYGNTNGYFYTYSDCDPVVRVKQAVDVGSGSALTLTHVVKTTAGFVGVNGTSANIYVSTDGTHWNVAGTLAGGASSSPLVAACGNDVLVISGQSSISFNSQESTDGGSSFSVISNPYNAYGTWVDLVCTGNAFALSGGNITNYVTRRSAAGVWIMATTAPVNYPLALALNGSNMLGYYMSYSTPYNYYSLGQSTDSGQTWSGAVVAGQIGSSTTAGIGFSGAITYFSGHFYSPYRTSSACIMRRFVDTTAFDDSVHSPVCNLTNFTRVKGIGSILLAVGTLDGSTTPLMLLSTDSGATWSTPALPAAAGVTSINELIAF